MNLNPEDLEKFQKEYADLVIALRALLVKYHLQNEAFLLTAVGWYSDEAMFDSEEAEMTISYSINFDNEEEMDEVMSFLYDAYRHDASADQSKIDYWINLMGGKRGEA